VNVSVGRDAAGDGLAWDATPFLPPESERTLDCLREAAQRCRGCDLYQTGTRTVFGEGPRQAPLVLVGEQPGDSEDREGRPFVGPAGRLLDEALQEVGIDRSSVYLTNAVKHFKWVARGKRRIHSKPNARELRACKAWLDAELAEVEPRLLVCLGATAAQALLGPSFRVSQSRGQVLENTGLAPYVITTVHPASVLRSPDPKARLAERQAFVDDLRTVKRLLDV
jgi:uracil-DNA glycosylase family protein